VNRTIFRYMAETPLFSVTRRVIVRAMELHKTLAEKLRILRSNDTFHTHSAGVRSAVEPLQCVNHHIDMYHVRQLDFGYVLTLKGAVEAEEMKSWYHASQDHLSGMEGPFGVLVDARNCHPLSKVARFWLLRGQSACEEAGLERAAVLVNSATQEGYWPGLISVTNPAHRVRFIDAARHYPRVRALSWILKGVEPNLNEGSVAARPAVSSPGVNERAMVQAAGL